MLTGRLLLYQADVNLKFSDSAQPSPDKVDSFKPKPEIKVCVNNLTNFCSLDISIMDVIALYYFT